MTKFRNLHNIVLAVEWPGAGSSGLVVVVIYNYSITVVKYNKFKVTSKHYQEVERAMLT
jgi:hypothetical protein